MNKLNFKRLLSITIFAFVMAGFIPNAFSVARLATCSANGGSGAVSEDGSNCDQGLICDSSIKICVALTETGCKASDSIGGGCTVGQKCTTGAGNATAFQTQNLMGICMPVQGGSAENNALGDVVCNVYRLITGKVGRGVVVVVLFVTGISFYLGKVNWGTIVAIVIGAGLCFGGPAIVSVFLGKNFLC